MDYSPVWHQKHHFLSYLHVLGILGIGVVSVAIFETKEAAPISHSG